MKAYGRGSLPDLSDPDAVHAAKLLMLDISEARFNLGWKPRLDMEKTIELTVDWYRRYRETDVYGLCVEQIKRYRGI